MAYPNQQKQIGLRAVLDCNDRSKLLFLNKYLKNKPIDNLSGNFTLIKKHNSCQFLCLL
ncbi:MAG: hypothetical protein H6940_03395 [Burkholderiales bacterium]|nr:hypothetical protein [Burkholderiales bacterium]